MIRLTHFVAIDMKTRLFITDIRKISFDRVGELSPERAERVQRCRRADDKLRCIAGGLFMNKFLGGAKITVNECFLRCRLPKLAVILKKSDFSRV
mgnify:CR=1 FL=1